MGAGQRGLAEILPDEVKEVIEEQEPGSGAVSQLQILSEEKNKDGEDDADLLREQVSVFEDHVRKLISRINWLQENLQQEEESRQDAEKQAECLRIACAEQAGKVDELSEQIGMLFQDLDEQHKHWTSLEAKLEFEQQERLQIEATLKALAVGFLAFPQQHLSSSPQSPQSPRSPQSAQSPQFGASANHGINSADGWTSSSPECRADCRPVVSWSNLEEVKKQQGSKTDNMFKELNSEWSNYKSEGKLGSWSLAKVLRRLSFSDARKKRLCATNNDSAAEGGDDSRSISPDFRRAYDTATLTEEIFSLNSEASDVRQRHLADLRKRLELQHFQSSRVDGDDSESLNDDSSKRASKFSKSVSRSSSKRLSSQKSNFESEHKNHFKIENLGRQVFHLKKLCTEKTQLVKLEKRRRSEVENRYYVLVKNLDKQLLQLRKIYLRKSEEIKQEKTRRQEAEKRSLAEVESLERQVARLSKLAESRAQDVKHEQKQRVEAQKKLKDLVNQLKTARQAAQSSQPIKPERSPKTKPVKAPGISPPSAVTVPQSQAVEQARVLELVEEEGKDDGDIVELEALQFRKLGTRDSCELNSDRQIWKLQARHKGRFVLTQVEHAVKVEQSNSMRIVEEVSAGSSTAVSPQELEELQAEKAAAAAAAEVFRSDQTGFADAVEESRISVSSLRTRQETEATTATRVTASRPGSLTNKIFQLKETTSRLLKDLEGTQQLLNTDKDVKLNHAKTPGGREEEQGKVWDSQADVDGSDCNNSLFESEGDLKQQFGDGFREVEAAAGGGRLDHQLRADRRKHLELLPAWEDTFVERHQNDGFVEGGEEGKMLKKFQGGAWMGDVKRQLQFMEKLMVRLGGLVFERAENIQQQISANRDLFDAKVEVLKHDLKEILVDNSNSSHYITQRTKNIRARFDGQIGLRFVCQLDSQVSERSSTTTPEPDFF